MTCVVPREAEKGSVDCASRVLFMSFRLERTCKLHVTQYILRLQGPRMKWSVGVVTLAYTCSLSLLGHIQVGSDMQVPDGGTLTGSEHSNFPPSPWSN